METSEFLNLWAENIRIMPDPYGVNGKTADMIENEAVKREAEEITTTKQGTKQWIEENLLVKYGHLFLGLKIDTL